ncbi:PREDICTED: magnesium transporter MRS2-I-like [Ipomoea nil]|uniref:magnesium transporter MRS2-I-like n=1 Tax=Ipomoea nil TaxID=35883 RepID=UPI000900EA6E|nr:PREDICTED: magnesium transporter MRS2-I-like [Ipomoea nil]
MSGGDGYEVPVAGGGGGAALLKKKGAVGWWRWVRMEATGEENVVDVDKYEILQRVKIHAHDLRILDPLLSYPSTILARQRAILLNLEHIKAIITAQELFLRDPLDESVAPVVEELRRRLKPVNGNHGDQAEGKGEVEESPFEVKALEVALEAVCSYLDAQTSDLEAAVYPALDLLTSKISSQNLDRVRKLKSQMTRLTARVQKVRDEIEKLLDDDDDMADLYLSRKSGGGGGASSSPVSSSFLSSPTDGSKRCRASSASMASFHGDDENDIEELEMLLEAYFMQIEGTLNKLVTLREYTDSTEDYINIQLDNHRNQLIQLELFLSTGMVAISIYSLVTGIFGMNIKFPLNEGHGYMFKWVLIVTGAVSTLLFLLIIAYARYKGLGF